MTERSSLEPSMPDTQPRDTTQYEQEVADAASLAVAIWGVPKTGVTAEQVGPDWSLTEDKDLNNPLKYIRIRLGWHTFVYDNSDPSMPGFRKDVVNDRYDHFGYGAVLVRDNFSYQRALADNTVVL